MKEMNLDQRINTINIAYNTLYGHKTLLWDKLNKLSNKDGPLIFIEDLSLLDEDFSLSIWNKKFIIRWEFRKGDLKLIQEKNYYLMFTIFEIKVSGSKRIFEEIDSFILTYFKDILYKEEENLTLEFIPSLVRTFKLIFETYFNNNMIKPAKAK